MRWGQRSSSVNLAKRRLITNTTKLIDLGFLVFALGLTTLLVVSERGTISFADFLALRIKLGNFILFAGLLFIWHLILSLCGLYESKRLSTRHSEVIDVLKATTLSTLCLMVPAAFFAKRTITLAFLVLFWIFSSTLMVLARLTVRYLLGIMRRRGRNYRYILILGTNSRAMEFAARIGSKPELGYRVLGFVDDDWPGNGEFLSTGHKLCCDFAGLSEFLRHNVVDEVAIYLPLRSFYEHTAQVAALCELHGIIMRINSDIFNLKIAKSHAEDFDGQGQIMATAEGQQGWPHLVKRALDICVSLVLLVVLAPVLFVTALLIRLMSPGPIFFDQKRVGLNKRQFVMYKFRTMIPNAEKAQEQLLALNEMTGPVFKIKNDPRVTPIGRFLRKTSLDELPQLWNVLTGDMSLVGPRAMSVRDYQFFSEDWQRRRFSVRPGITCLWQVNGRNSIPFEQWMQLDMQYIDKWSLWLDLKILARTIPAVLKGSGAA
jgi:exopolysaccharide biosynthesis polyprenyl glycosylphosphotransferase